MTHCGDCGEKVVNACGVWEHEPSPDGMDPAECVLGTSDGVAHGSPGSTAYPCTDASCPDPVGPPWWAEAVEETA